MKLVIALVLLTAVATQAFLFNGGCKTDTDCKNGCCQHSFFRSRCIAKSAYLQTCTAQGCGCQPGLKCVMATDVTSVAVETHVGSTEMLCEMGAKVDSTMAPTTAV